MNNSNENSFISQLRPPSNFQSPGKLQEMTASAANARHAAMLPPKGGVPRKTLAERAGETAKPATGPPNSRSINTYARATSIAGIPREASFSSSVASSRPSSVSSARNVSSSSYSSSYGPGSRPPSAQTHRAQSALGHSRLQRPNYGQSRPTTSLEMHQEEPITSQVLGKRKSETPFSSMSESCTAKLQPPKLRGNRNAPMTCVSNLERRPFNAISRREISLSIAMGSLNLCETPNLQSDPRMDAGVPPTPSHIPKMVPRAAVIADPPSPSKSPKKTPKPMPQFLNKDTNSTVVWDHDSRLEEVENMCSRFKEDIKGATAESNGLKEMTAMYKTRIAELETIRAQLSSSNTALQTDLDATRARLASNSEALEDSKRYQNNRIDDMQRQHRRDFEELQDKAENEKRKLAREHLEKTEDLQKKLETTLEDERVRHQKEVQSVSLEGSSYQEKAQKELEKQLLAFQALEDELERCRGEVSRERDLNNELRGKLAESAKNAADLETSVRRLEGHIHFLESDNKSQSQAFADLETRMQNALKSAAEANEKLVIEETLRRKLHNQVQELKGNIRVFCRVRPSLESDSEDASARINYPDDETDSKEVEVMGQEEKSSLGTVTTKKNAFAFDRVFGPGSQNEDVFGEISQLVQSALDGYNVCIFCYGQTGSGKTFTMSSNDGMIPRAVHQIYDTAKSLEEKGWSYKMEGSFIEVYNENLNDLLGKAEEFDKKKHEIRHDTQKSKTTITGIATVELDSPGKVESILTRATSNRSVAATQANERSSRSHSVFILKLIGENSITGERSEGTLNLVDLAGSERLSHSGATGDRLKETQNINKSLSCLGDVIGALGQGKEGGHVPYRNSKLTYLLQYSLGGNSKTLMFVMISPLQAHLSETLTSLKFATKVHNTHIGTAKKQIKTHDK